MQKYPSKEQKLLDKAVFFDGLEKLKFIFRIQGLELKDKELCSFYYERLKDLETNKYSHTIEVILRTLKEIYPNTNLIATIREYYEKNKQYTEGLDKKKQLEQKKVENYLNSLSSEDKKAIMNKADEEIKEDITLTEKIKKYFDNNGKNLLN